MECDCSSCCRTFGVDNLGVVRHVGRLLDGRRGSIPYELVRVRLVISRLVLIFALPLDFHGRVRVVRSMYLPAALHGIEAALLASDRLRKLRSSIHKVVWSRRQPLANIGAVLSLLDGPTGCDPFVWSGFVFVYFVGIWLFGLLRLVGFIVF